MNHWSFLNLDNWLEIEQTICDGCSHIKTYLSKSYNYKATETESFANPEPNQVFSFADPNQTD